MDSYLSQKVEISQSPDNNAVNAEFVRLTENRGNEYEVMNMNSHRQSE
jgi:hypothetical protein